MSNHQLHVYMVKEEPYDREVYTYVWLEDEQGNLDLLRCGTTTKPEWLVCTSKQLGVKSFLYDITEEQAFRNAWSEATVIPEEEW